MKILFVEGSVAMETVQNRGQCFTDLKFMRQRSEHGLSASQSGEL
jgi:hypothetical protein